VFTVPRNLIPDPPCDHYDRMVGTIGAGDIYDRSQPHCSVATCCDCIAKSAGYVQMRTGLPATPFLGYEDARAARNESAS